jgi:DNA-binding Lrp family transcriptional regulator
MDRTDRQIIQELQKNARQTNQEIAAKLKLAPSTLTRRIQWLEDNKVISGYTCIIDPSVLGYNSMGFTLVKFSKISKAVYEQVVERLRKVPEIAEIYKILGDEDLIVKVYAKDNADYQRVLEGLEPADADDGYHTKTLLVTEHVYEGGIADVVGKASYK